MKKFVLRKIYWLLFIAVILIVGVIYLNRSVSVVPSGVETGLVTRGEVLEVVSETGYVKAAQTINMAFERGGRVAELLAREGMKVSEGDLLIKLDEAMALSDLASAQARFDAERARLQELESGADVNSLAITKSAVNSAETNLANAKRNLLDVTAQQNLLVENAAKNLRTTNLQAYLVSTGRENSSDSFVAPTVTGSYNSEENGVYRIELYGSGAPSGASFRFSGIENGVGSVSTVSSVALGDHGLFLQFPQNFVKNTEWEIPVPNTRSSSYIVNQNAYKATAEGRTVAIAAAQSAVTAGEATLKQVQSQLTQVSDSARVERVVAQRALVRQMQASVKSAEVQLNNLTLRAPFGGVITNTFTEVGQIIGASAPAVAIISDGQYELTVAISEVDIAELSVGDKASVKFDAYDDRKFKAHVIRISPSAELIDGVRVFTVTLVFDEQYELIRDGLSADIDITTAKKDGVISIPTRAIYADKNGKFVRLVESDAIKSVYIKTGLRGSDGNSEVTEGLVGGETIITFADEDALKIIEDK